MVQPGSLASYIGVGGNVPFSNVMFSFLSMYFL